jgi:hypothetical protein
MRMLTRLGCEVDIVIRRPGRKSRLKDLSPIRLDRLPKNKIRFDEFPVIS